MSNEMSLLQHREGLTSGEAGSWLFCWVFFPLLFIPLLSVSRELQIRKRTAKCQMRWKIPCVG